MNKDNKLLKVFSAKCWEPLTVTFAGLFMVFTVGKAATVPFNKEIHNVFGTSDYIPVNDDSASSIDRHALKNEDDIVDYYRQVNEEVESEGLVLLKNESNALPLASGSKVTFVLSGSGKIFYATHGPGVRRDGEKDGAFYDFRRALKEETDLNVNDATYDFVSTGAGKTGRGKSSQGFSINEPSWNAYSAVQGEYDDSTALCVITRESGEGADESYIGSDGKDGSYLTLSNNEIGILEGLASLKREGKVQKIVILINSAVTLQCDFLDDEKFGIDAAMWIGLPGASGMRGVAKALVGKVNPSGSLSDTFLKDNFSNPAAMYWRINEGFSSEFENTDALSLNATQKYYGVYVEGIYVGYRYYETRYEDVVMNSAKVGNFRYSDVVAYPFGYGLSYTTFSYSDMSVTPKGDRNGKPASYEVKVKVTNTGSVAGKEPVQIYLQKPYTQHDRIVGVEESAVELVGFGKTGLLQPGAYEEVTVDVDFERLRSYDAEADKTYILGDGDYYLTAARDSHSAINNILNKKGFSNTDVPGESALAYKILTQDSVDKEIFSVSSSKRVINPSTGEMEDLKTPITNQLDWMDPNRFRGVNNEASEDGDVTYVSRRDWMGTLPAEKTRLSVTGKGGTKYDITSHKPIVEDEGAKMPTFGASTAMTLAMMLGLPYDDEQWDMLLDQLTQQEIFETLVQCYGYTPEISSITKPMTDEDDGPYGVSNTSQGYSSMSCEGIICATMNKDLIRKVGEAIASDARSKRKGEDNTLQKDLHGLYAPGLNIHRVAFGGRAAEYFSEDPYLSGIAGQLEIEEFQKQYVVACPKHFIFNDEETNRNGICVFMNEQAAREIYLEPWEYALRPDRGNSHSLMTSFNRAGLLWTSAASDIMDDIMRAEWGFDGYTLTDMAGSNGKLFMVYDDGFMNGTDCFLDKGIYTDMTPEMRNSATFNLRQRESIKRLLYVTVNYSAAMDGYSAGTKMVRVAVWWKVAIDVLLIVSAIIAVAGILIVLAAAVMKFLVK